MYSIYDLEVEMKYKRETMMKSMNSIYYRNKLIDRLTR